MPLMVIKKDNSRETYDRSKIESGVIRSCHKRPVSTQQIDSMIDEIENQIFNMEEREVSTNMIGELVMERLKELDEVAYVRFASVYREFKDVNTFMEELGKLIKKFIFPVTGRSLGCLMECEEVGIHGQKSKGRERRVVFFGVDLDRCHYSAADLGCIILL